MDYDALYKILAMGYYNGERRPLYYYILKKFLIEGKVLNNTEIKDSDIDGLPESIFIGNFARFDYIITSGLELNEVLEYTVKRYEKFDEVFNKKYGLPLSAFILLSYDFLLYADKISPKKREDFPVHEFERPEDYANLNFIAYPDETFVKNYKEVYTIDIAKFKESMMPSIRPFIDYFINLTSFDIESIKKEPSLRFKEFPLFRSEGKLIFVDPSIYLRYLPHKIHLLLTGCKNYDSKKGEIFEKMALGVIEKIPNSKLEDRNIKYNGYELDGLLNFRRSTWFVECKSRNVSPDSLRGDKKKIYQDIDKAIKDAVEQGERAIESRNIDEFKKYKIHRQFGILVVLEGIFPNIRLPTIIGSNPLDESKYPICILNYFELKKILAQPDSNLFEEFLIWRGQKPMPIYAQDELDYWAFFNDNYRGNKEMKRLFEIMKSRNITQMYISKRFNKKDYLRKIYAKDNVPS